MGKLINISQLSTLLNLVSSRSKKPTNYILRYWEKELKQIKPVFLRLRIAGSNAPTPGSIKALQSLDWSLFLINITSSPRLSRDFVTEWILPIP